MIACAAAVEEWFPVVQVGDAALLKGIDVRTAPNLHGYVSTRMKPIPAVELLQAGDTGEPILARWRVGLVDRKFAPVGVSGAGRRRGPRPARASQR